MSLRVILPVGAVALSLLIVGVAISVNSRQSTGRPLTDAPQVEASPVVSSSVLAAPETRASAGGEETSLSIVGSSRRTDNSVPVHPVLPNLPPPTDGR